MEIREMSSNRFQARVARNEMEGGSTGVDIKYQIHLTEPQGKLKICPHAPMFFL